MAFEENGGSVKKIIIIIFCNLILLCTILTIYFNDNDKVILKNENNSNRAVSSSALTMMYETEANSGEYQVANDTTWPQDGYIFNETLSKCENGSKLTWDDENKRVLMQANTSDKCYVYFDAQIVTIEFFINSNKYYTEEGMTWGEWVKSDYNTSTFGICEEENNFNIIFSSLPNGYKIQDEFGNSMSSNDLIIEDYNYIHWSMPDIPDSCGSGVVIVGPVTPSSN